VAERYQSTVAFGGIAELLWAERLKERNACIAVLEVERDRGYDGEKLLKDSNPAGAMQLGMSADRARDHIALLRERDVSDPRPCMVREYGPVT
jgi:hypothetical protein